MASTRLSSLGLGRVSVALLTSGSPTDPFREPLCRTIHVRQQQIVPVRRWVAGCFLLVLIIAGPALVLRAMQSRNDVSEHILQRHHIGHHEDPSEPPVATSSVLASNAAAAPTRLVSSAEHDLIDTGMELFTCQTHHGIGILIFGRSVHVAAHETTIWNLVSRTHVCHFCHGHTPM